MTKKNMNLVRIVGGPHDGLTTSTRDLAHNYRIYWKYVKMICVDDGTHKLFDWKRYQVELNKNNRRKNGSGDPHYEAHLAGKDFHIRDGNPIGNPLNAFTSLRMVNG
jgi:hypothetical protein